MITDKTAGRAITIAAHAPDVVEAACARLEEDGFVVLEGLLDADAVARLDDELAPWFAATPPCEGDFYGWRTTRVGGLLDKAPATQDLVMQATILAIVERLLAPSCDCIQLNLTQAVRVHGGERAQAPHRDEEMWPCAKGREPWLINVMWTISDFSTQNGATRLWPGSHRTALDRAVDPNASVAASMRRGSALLFLGALTHGAGANTTDEARTGVIVSYCLGWLKQYENQFLAYAPATVRTFAPALQRLLGYQMHRPNLGGVEGRDPIETLGARGHGKPHVDALTPALAREIADHYAALPPPRVCGHGD